MAARSIVRRSTLALLATVGLGTGLESGIKPAYAQQPSAFAQLPAKVLKVGEAMQVNLSSGQKIFISRKGYLAIHQLSPERFRLIALKKGELVVLVKSRADRVISQQTVLIRSSAPPAAAKAVPLPNDCRAKDIVCRQGTPAIVSGLARSWQQFFALRRWCQRQRCGFRLRLSPAARQRYQQFAKAALGERYQHEVLTNGVLLVCSSHGGAKGGDVAEKVALLLDAQLWQLPIAAQRCQRGSAADNYEVEALAFRLKDEDAERIGLNIAGTSFSLSASHSLKLHAFLADHRSLVIGHPTLQVNADQPSEFATGSEWFIADGDNKGQWKQVGFKIKLTVSPLADQRLKVGYQVEITGTKNGQSTALDRSYMASTMTLRPGVPQVVARLGTAMFAANKGGVPVIDGIPIIGPLLRHKVSTHSESRLFLWLHVKPAASITMASGRRAAPQSPRHPLALLRHPAP